MDVDFALTRKLEQFVTGLGARRRSERWRRRCGDTSRCTVSSSVPGDTGGLARLATLSPNAGRMFRRSGAGAAFACLLLATAGEAMALPRALLITGNDPKVASGKPYPPYVHEFHNQQIREILEDVVEITITEDLSALNRDNLATYDLVINYSVFRELTPGQAETLADFVSRGGGYLTLHVGLLSFLGPAQTAMMGGYFLGGPSTVPERFTVFPHDEWWGFDYGFVDQVPHPVGRGLKPFVMQDELYAIHFLSPKVEVIARAENHPVMWVHPYGKGSAMALTLGHGDAAKRTPGYQALLRNGVRWLVGAPILTPLQDGVLEAGAGVSELYADLDDHGVHPKGARLRYSVVSLSRPDLVEAKIDAENRLLLRTSGKAGEATITLAADGLGPRVQTSFSIATRQTAGLNLARLRSVRATASSSEGRKAFDDPNNVRDGDDASRWSSTYQDPTWIALDLARPRRIDRVRLLWQGAFAKTYAIQVSGDGERWQTVHEEENGDGNLDEIRFAPVLARHVRLLGKERALPRWGYSLFEFEVYAPKR